MSEFMSVLAESQVVEDISQALPDAEYVCSPEELSDMEWRIAEVRISDIFADEDLAETTLEGETEEEARARFESVAGWMSERGGPETALRESPVLLLYENDQITIIDGWHRCVVARGRFGAETVTAGIATVKAPEIGDDLSV